VYEINENEIYPNSSWVVISNCSLTWGGTSAIVRRVQDLGRTMICYTIAPIRSTNEQAQSCWVKWKERRDGQAGVLGFNTVCTRVSRTGAVTCYVLFSFPYLLHIRLDLLHINTRPLNQLHRRCLCLEREEIIKRETILTGTFG